MKNEEGKNIDDFDLASRDSSLLPDDLKEKKRQGERKAYLYGILAQFFWAAQSIQMKADIVYFQDSFTLNNLSFWRGITLVALSYFKMKHDKREFKKFSEMKYKGWFLIRHIGFYFMVLLWLSENIYFRVSTCQCFVNCSPVIVLIISVFLLGDKFYLRYVYGLTICLVGALFIIFNETKTGNSDEIKKIREGAYSDPIYSNIFIGISIATSHLLIISFANIGQKMIIKDNIGGDEQNFYMGAYSAFPAFFVSCFQMKFGLNNIGYILFAMSHGILFYIGNYLTAEALKLISINKFMPVTYLCIVFCFILGLIIFGERVYFTDVIGSLLIMGFQFYNIYVPTTK